MPLAPRKRAAAVNSESAVANAFDLMLKGLGSKASRDGYEKDWVAFREWLTDKGLNVLKVETADVKRYVFELLEAGKARATRGRALSVLRESFRALVEAGLMSANPAREVKNPKHGGTQRTPWLDEEALAKLLAWRGASSWLDQRDRLCVQLVAGLGWRRAEIARMRVEDFKRAAVFGTLKGGKKGTATVAPWLRAEIEAWCAFAGLRHGALLPRAVDNPTAISGDIVYNIVQRVGQFAGIPRSDATPHALRRTLATLADQRDVSLADIQQSLGHSSRATTERYLKGSRQVEHAPGEWMSELVKGKETGKADG